jgi:hypothetical protein
MNALGQFLNSVSPLVAKGVMPFQAAQSMMLAIVRRFRFGPEIEDYIKQMKSPPPPPDPGQAEAAKHQAEQAASVQKEQIKATAQGQQQQSEQTREAARLQAEGAQHAAEQETRRQEIAAETLRASQRLEFERREKQAERAQAKQIEMDKARLDSDTDLRKAALQAAVAIETAAISATKSPEAATGAEDAAGQQVASTAELMARILDRQEKMLAIVMPGPH